MKIVYIEWVDACVTERYHKDVPNPTDKGLGLSNMTSVGIVVEETDEYLALSVSMADNGWYSDIINIPKVTIKKTEVLNH